MMHLQPAALLTMLLLLTGCPFEAVIDAENATLADDDDDAVTQSGDDDDATNDDDAADDDDAVADDDDIAPNDDDTAPNDDDTVASDDDDTVASDDDDTVASDDDDTVASDDDDTAPDDDDIAPTDDDDVAPTDDDDVAPTDDDDVAPTDDDDAALTCSDDGLEDNDAASLATSMVAGLQPALVSCEGDEDWFAVDLVAGDEFTVQINFSHAEGDIDLVVLDPAGVELGSSETVSDAEAVGPLVAATDGPHQVRVFLYGDLGTVPGSTYDLQIDVVPFEEPDPDPTPDPAPDPTPDPAAPPFDCGVGDSFEPNDTEFGATYTGSGTYLDLTQCGDDDYYWLSVGSYSDVYVDVWFTHAEGDIDLGILDGWGGLVDASTSEDDNESVSTYTGFFGDDFTIFVELYSDDGPWVGVDYEMDVFVY